MVASPVYSSTFSLGSHSIAAVYNGDTNFKTSFSASVVQNVRMAKADTTLTSSANPSVFGQSVTFTAQVAASAPGVGEPTGSVTFMSGNVALGTVALSAWECESRNVEPDPGYPRDHCPVRRRRRFSRWQLTGHDSEHQSGERRSRASPYRRVRACSGRA